MTRILSDGALAPRWRRCMQRLYSRCDLLSEAGADLSRAIDALSDCRDAARGEDLAALEQIAAGVRRDREALQARIERMEALLQRR